jgi:hypothetical protein
VTGLQRRVNTLREIGQRQLLNLGPASTRWLKVKIVTDLSFPDTATPDLTP